MTAERELRDLLHAVRMQGRIEGVIACTETVGGFIDYVERGIITDDWLDKLKVIRNAMNDLCLRAELDNLEPYAESP